MREFLFAILGFIIGGGGVYFLSSAKLQRQLASAEGKLKRANRATDDMDNLRSQQLSQSEELQNAQARIYSMEADYQAKVSEYEKQIQEQQVSLQSYETQIRELQNNHQQEIAALQSSLTQASPPPLPTTTEVAPSPEPSQAPNWLGTVAGGAAIAGVAGLAGAAVSGLFSHDEAVETPSLVREEQEEPLEAIAPPSEEIEVFEETAPEENWVDAIDAPPEEEFRAEIPASLDSESSPFEDESFELSLETPEIANFAESSPFEEESFELFLETPEVAPEIASVGELNLSDWTEEENLGEEESVREEAAPWPSEQPSPFDDPFSPSLETPIAVEEDNWVDAVDIPLEDVNLSEPDLGAWAEGDNALEMSISNDFPPVLEEISSVDTTMDSLELPADFLADIPSDHANLEPLTEELNAESELDFLLELQQDDAITEDPDLLAFSEMPDLEGLEGLSDLSAELELGSEDLPLLDMFPGDQADQEVLPELPLSEPGQSGDTPFIDLLDSTSEKSDMEFLEMLQTEEDDFSKRLSIEESDDIFGDLFSPEPSLSTTEMDDIFGQTNEPENHPASEPGLEELFSDEALSLDNWDLPGTGDSTNKS
ncbi:MAG: OmpH family outer membrane protein [Snowella sp.]|nr:OmpH family outer membrane protein [Snowella sp.]